MKERPILFKPELLKVIVEGRKTQTRRTDGRWLQVAPGDLLWCKEKLMRQDADCMPSWAEYHRDGCAGEGRYVEPSPFAWPWQRSWLSPLHMPRRAARVFLEVIEPPRLEWVVDITAEDAKAEGFESREAFFATWNEIHPDIDLDSQVVVITFKLLAGN